MKLSRLTIAGFGSYQDECVLDLSDVSVCAVVGANGTGKSTLFDAVLWTLFGHTPDRSASSVVNENSSAARVEVVCTIDGAEHVFTRERHGTKPRAWYSGPEGSCESAAQVSAVAVDLLGCSADLASMTVFARQGNIDRFSTVSASHRRQLLSDAILGDYFDELRRITEEKLQEDTSSHADSLARLNILRESASQLEPTKAEITEAEIAAEEAKEEADRLKAASSGVDLGLLREAETAKRRLTDIQSRLLEEAEDEHEQQIANAEFHESAAEKAKERASVAANALDEAREKHSVVAADAHDADARLDALRGLESVDGDSALCWVCETELSPEHREHLIDSLESAVATKKVSDRELREVLRVSQKADNEHRKHVLEASKAAAAAHSADQRATLLVNEANRLLPLAAKAESLRARMEDAPSDREIRAAVVRHDRAQQRLGAVKDRLERALTSDELLPEAEKSHKKLKQNLWAGEQLKRAWHPSEVPHMVLSERLGSVVWCANEALSSLSQSMELRFATSSEAGKSRMPMAIEATLDGVSWRPYVTFSGGEKMRLDIAMRVGLCRALGVRFRSLVLDEGWGALDPEGSVSLAQLLTKLVSSGEMDAVYTVSHIRDAVEEFPSRITVQKTLNGSVARLVTV